MNDFFTKIDQPSCHNTLDKQGFVHIPQLLPASLCQEFITHYSDTPRYRSTINMGQRNYGHGEYRYFNYPLPEPIPTLRQQLYHFLLPLARQWALTLRQDIRYPNTHEAYLQECHQAGQNRPTALILQYHEGGYNCLHQDLYGDRVFPFQMVVMLSDPTKDFAGGQLVLTEQRPHLQSRAHVLTPNQGDAVILAVHHRPGRGPRGYHRVNMRHGVGTVTRGSRYTLGIILHDAE